MAAGNALWSLAEASFALPAWPGYYRMRKPVVFRQWPQTVRYGLWQKPSSPCPGTVVCRSGESLDKREIPRWISEFCLTVLQEYFKENGAPLAPF